MSTPTFTKQKMKKIFHTFFSTLNFLIFEKKVYTFSSKKRFPAFKKKVYTFCSTFRNLKTKKKVCNFHFQIPPLNALNALFSTPKMEKLKFLGFFNNRFIYFVNIAL